MIPLYIAIIILSVHALITGSEYSFLISFFLTMAAVFLDKAKYNANK